MIAIARGNVSFLLILDDRFHLKFGKNRNQDELTAEERLEVRLLLNEALKKIDDDEIVRALKSSLVLRLKMCLRLPMRPSGYPHPHPTRFRKRNIIPTWHLIDSKPAIATQGTFRPGKPNQGTPKSSSGRLSEGSPTRKSSSSGKPMEGSPTPTTSSSRNPFERSPTRKTYSLGKPDQTAHTTTTFIPGKVNRLTPTPTKRLSRKPSQEMPTPTKSIPVKPSQETPTPTKSIPAKPYQETPTPRKSIPGKPNQGTTSSPVKPTMDGKRSHTKPKPNGHKPGDPQPNHISSKSKILRIDELIHQISRLDDLLEEDFSWRNSVDQLFDFVNSSTVSR